MKKSKPSLKRKEESSIESISENEEGAKQLSDKVSYDEEIDIDQKRIKAAKRIIEDAKKTLKGTKRIKTKMLSQSDHESLNDSTEDQKVTSFLQSKLAESNKTLETHYFEKIKTLFDRKNKKLDQLFLKGHNRPITACCFNPVTTDLISVGKDGAILLFDFASGFKRRLLNPGHPKSQFGHSSELLCLDISFDGRFLVTGEKTAI